MRSVPRHWVLFAFSLAVPLSVSGNCPECPPNGVSEDEPNCGLDGAGGYDDFVNGGCGGFEQLFTPIQIGQTMCGTVAMNTVTGVRDTDWFEFVLTEQTELVLHFSAEFKGQVGVVDNGGVPDCNDVICFLGSLEEYPCIPVSFEMTLDPGTWWIQVAPVFDDEIVCDLRYTLRIVPQSLVADINGDGVVDGTDLKVLIHFWEIGQYYSPADLNFDGMIGINDLLLLLELWPI